MRPNFILVLAILMLAPMPAMTQQAGENINVLPVVPPQDQHGNPIADWQIKGDGFLQRQVEPTIAASTWNPDHLLAFFVDYRAVDIADDIGLGEDEVVIAAYALTRTIMMAATGLTMPEIHFLESPPIAAAEAWVGMSRSYDGGLTWSGGFLPGAPFDDSAASLAAPVRGLDAATDPVLAAGPCGKFYLVFMAFTRGDESKLVVARYQDNNYAGGGDHITYEGMTVLESGNNATHGYFLDKPDIEVDIARDPGAEICGHSVYVSYSTFNGLDNNGKFQSKVSFARSFDGGLTFDTQKLNPPYSQNQGSALAIDPTNGDLYMIWRHFNDPDAILMVRSTNLGKKWSKPVDITEAVPMAAFDQPSISIDDAIAANAVSPLNPSFPETAFRSNAFPTAAVTGDGTLFVAWQERVNSAGRPDELGAPRIVLVRSSDNGANWTDINGDPNRLAVDFDVRDVPGDPNTPPPGYGALPQFRPSGAQVKPKLAFSGGQMLLSYFESRGRIDNYETASASIVPSDLATTGFISGYDRLLDFRAALLDPTTGTMTSTIQVSRYPLRGDANLQNGEQLDDVAPVAPNCDPEVETCVRQVNRANAPQSAAGRVPFTGDYPDLVPVQQFFFDGAQWRWATASDDVPYQGFHAIFTDNRHLLPPPGPDEWNGFQFYDPPWESPPDNLAGCTNPGSRNTDVLTSKIDTSLVLSAPTTFKDLDYRRSFPFTVRNSTPESRAYRIRILEGTAGASFNRFDDTVDDSADYGNVEIFGHSSGSFLVYINNDFTDPVRVEVSEVCPTPEGFDYDCTGSSGILTFNADSGYQEVPEIDGPDTQIPELVGEPFFVVAGTSGDPDNPFVVNPFVVNPFVVNPFVVNPFVVNPFVVNPFVVNPFVVNPFVVNTSPGDIEAVVDTTWTISPGSSNSASSYLPVVNIDNAQAFIDAGYVFQLIIYKGSLYGGIDIEGCDGFNVAQPQILANVSQDPGAENPFVVNPFVVNPFVVNPFVVNPFVVNSSFTMAPADNVDAQDDFTTKAGPASDEIKITLRAFKTTPTESRASTGDGDHTKILEDLIFKPWQDPPSLVIVPQYCAPGDPEAVCRILSISPDLVPLGVDTTPVAADAGGNLPAFPAGGWTLANQGYPGQLIGDATAENGILRHGFYVCETDYIDTWNPDIPLVVTDPACAAAGVAPSATNTLALNATESIDPVDLSMPSWDEGDYYVVLFADDTLQVSERTEINNWVKIGLFIEEPNEPPVVTDLSFTIDEDTILSESLGVTDPDGDVLTFELATGPTSGAVVIGDNAFTYTPDENLNGADSFGFTVFDGEFTVGGTVSITVNPVNDPPVVTVGPIVVNEDGAAQGTIVATDVDGDTLSYVVSTPPAKGVISPIDPATGVFTYTPTPDLNGDDTFVVTVGDSTVVVTVTINVTITALPDAPEAFDNAFSTDEDTSFDGDVTATDVDGDTLSYALVGGATNGTVTIAPDGSFTYTPSADFAGTDLFTFKANDGDPTFLDSNIATVTMTVNAKNDPPTAVNASYEIFENTPFNGTLGWSDVDGDNVTFALGAAPSGGAVTIDPATGAFTYTPAFGFLGPDSFTFLVADSSDAQDVGTVAFNVIDPVPNWAFVGFATPWRPNYKVNAGSAVPLKWYYADPVSGAMVESFDDGLAIQATGYPTCDATGDPMVVLDLPEDAGASDLRYVDMSWQLNWDTAGLEKGCYYLSIYHPTTNQLDTTNSDGEVLVVQLK